MKTKTEIKEWLLENAVDQHGDLMLDYLDFSDFKGDVYIDNMRVKCDLWQSHQKVQGDLMQNHQKVECDLYNDNNEYGRILRANSSAELLKEITPEGLAKLGYRLKGG